jgi:hypothetical protein
LGAVVMLAAVPAMHEDVHERAGQDQQEGPVPEIGDEMCAMLGDKKESGNRQEAQQNNIETGAEETLLPVAVSFVVHLPLLGRRATRVTILASMVSAGSRMLISIIIRTTRSSLRQIKTTSN